MISTRFGQAIGDMLEEGQLPTGAAMSSLLQAALRLRGYTGDFKSLASLGEAQGLCRRVILGLYRVIMVL